MRTAGHASVMSAMIAAKGVIFRSSQSADYFVDWHNAPRRQFVVNLTGEVEITVSDGEMRRFGPGSILLAEDVHRQGPHLQRDRQRRAPQSLHPLDRIEQAVILT